MSAGTLDVVVGSRRWAVLERGKDTLDQELVERLSVLFHNNNFRSIPRNAGKTLRYRHLLCRAGNRIGAQFYQTVVVLHRMAPFLTLLLLVNPDATIQRLRGLCKLMLGPYTKGCLDLYGDNMGGLDARVEMPIVVIYSKSTAVHLDNSNARLRKALLSFSNQVKRPLLGTFNCSRIRAQIKRRERLLKLPAGASVRINRVKRGRQELAARRPQPAAAQKRGSGGSWRAFVREKCRGSA